MQNSKDCVSEDLLTHSCDAATSSSSATSDSIMKVLLGNEIRKIITLELSQNEVLADIVTSDDHHKILREFKSHPSYCELLNKLKNRTKTVLCALDQRKLSIMKKLLHEPLNEFIPSLEDDTSEVATKPELCCFGGALDDGVNVKEDHDSESDDSSASQGSSLTLRAYSPTEQEYAQGTRRRRKKFDNQNVDRLDEDRTSTNPTKRYESVLESSREVPEQHKQQQHRQQQFARRNLPPQISQSFSDADSSFSSCFNPSGFTVLNQDQLVMLAASLDRHHSPLTNRQQALRHLVHLPIIDIQACEAWSASGLLHQPSFGDSLIEGDGNVRSTSVHQVDQIAKTSPRDRASSLRRWTRTESNLPLGVPGGNLRTGLADALNDADETLWSLAMRYISKGLSTTPPNILETYNLLMEHLNYQFNTIGRKLPLVREGVDIDNYPVDRLVRACHLMNQFHRTITHYWIRHSEKFLNEIVTQCVNLLSIGCPNSVDVTAAGGSSDALIRLSPMHLLGLIDPQASWFNKWMHGTYSRIPLVDRLKRNPKLLNLILSILCRFLRKGSMPSSSAIVLDSTEVKKSMYSEAELEYALFLHSINILRHLLCHAVGRSLFKAQTVKTSADEPTSIKFIICMMANYVRNQSPSPQTTSTGSIPFAMTASCLADLAKYPGSSEFCLINNCDVDFDQSNACSKPLDILISGLLNLFDTKNSASLNPQQRSERFLKLESFTSILRNLASHATGRRALHAYIPATNRDQTLISKLQQIIHKELSVQTDGDHPSQSNFVIALIDLCGSLNALQSNRHLHSVVSVYQTLVSSCKKMLAHYSRAGARTNSADWYLLLKRNLIQVAESTLGLTVLRRAELLKECAQILFVAHHERLKCSLIQSHFWGLILTQMASCMAGARALCEAHVVHCLVTEAWKAVEFPCSVSATERGDTRIGQLSVTSTATAASSPPNWPVDPIDSFAYKPFINLVKVTSSFEAIACFTIYERLKNASPKSAMPESFLDFIDRSVLLNTEEKMRSLYNLDQTQIFGLRLLSCVVSDLDSMLLLCTQLDLLHILIQLQLDTFTQNVQSGAPILDALVLERNYLLVKCYFCGGPTERRLPNRFLCEHRVNMYSNPIITQPPNVDDPATDEYYAHPSLRNPICDRFPCTSWYESLYPTQPKQSMDCSIASWLTQIGQIQTANKHALIDSAELANEWILGCQRILRLSASSGFTELETFEEEVDFGLMLQNCLRSRQLASNVFEQPAFDSLPDASNPELIQSMSLSPFEVLGIETAIRYGQRIGALAHDTLHPLTDSGHVAALANLMKRVQWGLSQLRMNTDGRPETGGSAIHNESDTERGFDWFTATIFIAFRGDANLAWNFLSHFAADSLSLYIWPYRAQFRSKGSEEDTSTLHVTAHYLDHMLALECPNIYNTFVLAELPPSQIARRWMKQCFWNYLDWGGIMDYLLLCLIHPEPYHIYFLLAVIRHMREAIRLATTQSPTDQQQQPQQLVVFLQEEPIRGFKAFEHLTFMNKLYESYGTEWKQSVDRYGL